jgi:3',5'-cyclic AMP phosphodiesterase CpdA
MTALRVIHLSDVHVRQRGGAWRPRDVFGKRTTGWLNLNLTRRGRLFRGAAPLVARIAEHVRTLQPDFMVFSGDATALGFPGESLAVALALGVGRPDCLPGIAVPGNHDHYTQSAVLARGFETAFGPWMQGERAGEFPFPFARRAGDVWFVGVNSCVPNYLPWDTRGAVGVAQLGRLDALLGRLGGGPRVLVTHYPYVTAEGLPEPPVRALRDREQLAELMHKHGVRAWLCGHRHRAYHIGPTDRMPFFLNCSGSATQSGLASFSELLISADAIQLRRHVLTPGDNQFTAGEWYAVRFARPFNGAG